MASIFLSHWALRIVLLIPFHCPRDHAKAGSRPRWNIPGADWPDHIHCHGVLVTGAQTAPNRGRSAASGWAGAGNLAAAGTPQDGLGLTKCPKKTVPPEILLSTPQPCTSRNLPATLPFPIWGSVALPGRAAPPPPPRFFPPSARLRESPLISP